MPRHQVAVRHPRAVAPGERGALGVDVGVGGADVGDGREDDRVEALLVEPRLKPLAAGALEAGSALGDVRDLFERGHARRAGAVHVVGEVDVFRREAAEVVVVLAGQGARRVGEDPLGHDVDEPVEPRVAVRLQELLPAPHRQLVQLAVGEALGHVAAGDERAVGGFAARLVVGDDGQVDLDDLGAGGLQVAPRGAPLLNDGCAGRDSLATRVVAVDVQLRHAEPAPGESPGGSAGLRQRGVRRRTHC